MIPKDFKKYFDSYAKRSPLAKGEILDYSILANAGLVVPSLPSKFCDVSIQECASVGIELPNIYEIKDGFNASGLFGAGNPRFYALKYNKETCKALSNDELRAFAAHEIKHLYQNTDVSSREQAHALEYDADRAALRATSYEVVSSMLGKAFCLGACGGDLVERGKIITAIVNNTAILPSLAYLEKFEEDETDTYPSIAARLYALREYALSFDRT